MAHKIPTKVPPSHTHFGLSASEYVNKSFEYIQNMKTVILFTDCSYRKTPVICSYERASYQYCDTKKRIYKSFRTKMSKTQNKLNLQIKANERSIQSISIVD